MSRPHQGNYGTEGLYRRRAWVISASAGGNVGIQPRSGENELHTAREETIPVGYRPAETSNVPIDRVSAATPTFILYGEHTGRVVMLGNREQRIRGMHRRMEDRRPDARRIASGHWLRRLHCLAVTPRVIARMRRSCRTRPCPYAALIDVVFRRQAMVNVRRFRVDEYPTGMVIPRLCA